MLDLAGVKASDEVIYDHLVNGAALNKFHEMVLAQGGDLDDLYRPSRATYTTDIVADEDGYIEALSALEFGLFAMRLGAGRSVKTDKLNYETGIVFHKKVGDVVKIGDNVATIYSDKILDEKEVTEFKKNVKINREKSVPQEIIEIIS